MPSPHEATAPAPDEALAGLVASVNRYHDALAASLALNRSDLDCLAVLAFEGAIPAGRLSELTGLTTGGVSGILDRLQSSGFIERRSDPGDRRRVLVSLTPGQEERLRRDILPLGDPEALPAGAAAALSRYIASAARALDTRTRELRGPDDAGSAVSAQGAVTFRLDGSAPRLLELDGGAHQLCLRAVPGGTFEARFDDQRVRVALDQATVRVSGRRLTHLPAGRIDLPAAAPWSLLIRGGANGIDADLAGVELREVTLHGGMIRATVRLGAPTGTVSIRVTGGSGALRLQVPSDAEVSVAASGGLGDIDFLGRRASRGGRFAAVTPGFETAANRFAVALKGGMTNLAVERITG